MTGKEKGEMLMDALEHVDFDYTIVMPHFIPDYKPVLLVRQLFFHMAELTSGYIRKQVHGLFIMGHVSISKY